MAFFDRIKDSVSVVTADASQKVYLTTEKVKINNQIQNNNKEIEKLIHQIGMQCVNLHLMEEDTEYEELFSEIRRLQSANVDNEKKIQQLSEDCEQQMMARQQGLKEKQEQREQERKERQEQLESVRQEPRNAETEQGSVSDEEVVYCAICGMANDTESKFCIGCGTRIEKPETPSEEESFCAVENQEDPSDHTGTSEELRDTKE